MCTAIPPSLGGRSRSINPVREGRCSVDRLRAAEILDSLRRGTRRTSRRAVPRQTDAPIRLTEPTAPYPTRLRHEGT